MKKLSKFLENHLDECLLLGGCGAIVHGVSLWNVAVAWVVAGVLLIGLAFLIGKVEAHESAE